MLYSEQELQAELAKAKEHFLGEVATLRTGRAHPDMLKAVKVQAYGMLNDLNTVGHISAPEPLLLTVQAYDPNVAKDIEDAIRNADLGLNPVTDGNLIRINLPSLTQETRLQNVKLLGSMLESAHVSVRNTRRKYIDIVDSKKGSVSEDEQDRDKAAIEKKIAAANEELDAIAEAKESELMSL